MNRTRKLKLYQCKECGKTYADEMASREDNICKTCMSKIDKDRKPRENKSLKTNEKLEKLSDFLIRNIIKFIEFYNLM